VPQAYYNAREGVKRLTTETGAGQWGSALAFAGAFFKLDVTVYMVKVSYEQKPYRRAMMETWGATVHASPTKLTNAGRGILAADPDSPGSLGIAISEAVEDAATHEDAKYSLGSVVNHVLLHQTVIGLEAKKQMEMAGEYPDVVIGCVGGGSNFAGLTYPFIADRLKGRQPHTRFIAAEPAACPTLTRGVLAYDFGDAVGMGPVVKMFTLGHSFIPDPIHAGGLRYHGDAPSLCMLVDHKVVEPRAYKHPSQRTQSAPLPKKQLPRGRQASGAPSCSAFRGTATSTCPPMTLTSPASWKTSRSHSRESTRRSNSCPESRR